jgi:predicted RNA-binding protein Jag
MGFLEKTGKNVDEALEQALNELKTTRDKVNIEVIEEAKNGLFGLFSKKAIFSPSRVLLFLQMQNQAYKYVLR